LTPAFAEAELSAVIPATSNTVARPRPASSRVNLVTTRTAMLLTLLLGAGAFAAPLRGSPAAAVRAVQATTPGLSGS
jgi:hypothetical protein